jgi:hydrogenase maturation protein HypF
VEERHWQLISEMTRTGLNSPLTSSMGRLFDAAAALCGIRPTVNYEGQAAIEFEAACDPSEHGAYELSVSQLHGSIVIDPLPALTALTTDLQNQADIGAISARYHAGVAAATVQACLLAASVAGTENVVLAGGVFQNRRLLELTAGGLRAAGVRVLVPRLLPPGDGGISYGQAAVAARRLTQ